MTNFPSSMGYRYGIITSAGFEIVAGEPGDPFEFIFQESSGFNGTSECSGLLWVELHDIFADSWNGLIFGLYNTDGEEDVFVQTVTMDSGSYHLDVCLLVEPGSCYAFLQIQSGSWDSEATWNLCDAFGGATNELYFCVDEEGVCIPDACLLNLVQEDSFGDGWNGYYFSLYAVGSLDPIETVTLLTGSSGFVCLNADVDMCYTFSASSIGSWAYEISWDLCGATGYYDTEVAMCIDSEGDCNLETDSLTVNFPNGGVAYAAGDDVYVSWSSPSGVSVVDLLLKDGPTTVQIIATNFAAVLGETTFTLQDGLAPGEDYWVMVLDAQEDVYAASGMFTVEALMCTSDDDCQDPLSCICISNESRKLKEIPDTLKHEIKKGNNLRRLHFGNPEDCYCM